MYNIDDPNKETARERAKRIWNNNRIIRESQATDQSPQPTRHNASTLKHEILKIFADKNQETLRNYIIAINERRRRLLREKLRRLRAESEDE
jgi:hypothetical protein